MLWALAAAEVFIILAISFSLACSQVGNPLLVRLCVDLKEAMEPKVTVKSVGGFEGKVWE